MKRGDRNLTTCGEYAKNSCYAKKCYAYNCKENKNQYLHSSFPKINSYVILRQFLFSFAGYKTQLYSSHVSY